MTPEQQTAVAQRAATDRAVAAYAEDRAHPSTEVAAQLPLVRAAASDLAAELGGVDLAAVGRALVSMSARMTTLYVSQVPDGVMPSMDVLAVLILIGRAGEVLVHAETDQTGVSDEG